MATLTGTQIADTLTGTNIADQIAGSGGDDRLSGGRGDDRLAGGDGADRLFGGDGDDVLLGGDGVDTGDDAGAIAATRLATGFSRPVFATVAPGDDDRLYVIEQHTGQIRLMDAGTGAIAATSFLDIPDAEISRGGEEGLLGLAFHPDYASNGRFFVFVVNASGDLEVREYGRATADTADPAFDVILAIGHPGRSNHNGGWMGFGPDGMLHIAVGDGGGGGDPGNNAQNTDRLLGKLLRIDVDGDDFTDAARDYAIPDDNPFVGVAGADEIWAYGLRNPWRPSFDRATGDLYIADVGQSAREEINFAAAGDPGGVNYGWRVREGTAPFNANPPGVGPLVDPIHEYLHGPAPDGGLSVTGGYVYRGTAPGLQGVYFYADFVTDQLWSFRVVDGVAVDTANRTAQLVASGGTVDNVVSFAEDTAGNLYILGLDGEVFRLDPQAGAGDGGDRLDGGAGRDRVFGGAGADLLLGGSGDDLLVGGVGADTLLGGADADSLVGGAGADRLAGQGGADRVRGGAGADVFVYARGDGRDVVADFAAGDTLDLSGVAGADPLALAFERGGDVVFAFGGGDTLILLDTTRAELAGDILIA